MLSCPEFWPPWFRFSKNGPPPVRAFGFRPEKTPHPHIHSGHVLTCADPFPLVMIILQLFCARLSRNSAFFTTRCYFYKVNRINPICVTWNVIKNNPEVWILPNNHPLYSAFAQDSLASKGDWNGLLTTSDGKDQPLPLMWKSKPLSVRTWLQGWKRVFWRQPLSGRMLKPSIHTHFVESYTATLEDIPASLSLLQENSVGPMIPDTFGRTSNINFTQLDLFSASSRTSPGTLISDTERSDKTWKKWVMQLRKEYSARKKLARLTGGNGFSSLQSNGANWPTPRAAEHKGTGPVGSKSHKHRLERDYLDAVVEQVTYGHPAPDSLSMTGKPREQLNPAWVAQLMGTTLGKTFFVPMVTQWWNKQQN